MRIIAATAFNHRRRCVVPSSLSGTALAKRYYHASAPQLRGGITTQWADPAMRQYKYWNREEHASETGQFKYLIEISPESIEKEAKILSLSDPDDEANAALHKRSGNLPLGSSLLGIGTTLQEFDHLRGTNPNVLFVSPSCPRASIVLPMVLAAFPSIEWVHVRSAGIDFLDSTEFAELAAGQQIMVTNAKGQFSSSLAEYALFACSYFAKNLPRLMSQQKAKKWQNFDIEELRGKTVGIVGYGDIGRACAKLASTYGMRIIALRRHPFLSKDDPLCDVVYGRDRASLNKLMSESDYIICSAPSTVETRGMVDAEAFENVKENAVFINLGRGPVIDESALIKALKTGKLKGAALDVFTEEPLPEHSEMWDIPNLLISPHNMDQTATFMHEATAFFLNENLPRYICGEELLNPVDPMLGY